MNHNDHSISTILGTDQYMFREGIHYLFMTPEIPLVS